MGKRRRKHRKPVSSIVHFERDERDDDDDNEAQLHSDFELRRTCDFAPVQYEGECDGVHWYFRSRGQHFTLSFSPIAQDEGEVDELLDPADVDEILRGEISIGLENAASDMPHSVAQALIRWMLSCHRNEKKRIADREQAAAEYAASINQTDA